MTCNQLNHFLNFRAVRATFHPLPQVLLVFVWTPASFGQFVEKTGHLKISLAFTSDASTGASTGASTKVDKHKSFMSSENDCVTQGQEKEKVCFLCLWLCRSILTVT